MNLIIMLVAFSVAVAITGWLLAKRSLHIAFTGDCPHSGHHKTHSRAVPRVGGAAVFAGGLVGLVMLSPELQARWGQILWIMWGCLSLVFGIGLAEDISRRITPAIRYLGVLVAAVLFSVALDGFGVSSVAIAPVDGFLAIPFFKVLFFAFCVAGLAHAFNLVDGYNGLCAGYSLMAQLGLGAAAALSGHAELSGVCFALAAANLGFLIFNLPAGAIFLGDGGAYFNGAVTAVLAVLFVEYTLDISPWFPILLFIYPIWETFFSMMRRFADKTPFYHPDREHLHHRMASALKMHLGIPERWCGVGALVVAAPPVLVAPFASGSATALVAGSVVFALSYSLLYYVLPGATAEPADPEAAAAVAQDAC